MVIPGSQITNMVGTSYMVTVTVSNFLGAVSSATWSFTKKGLGITPVVTLPSGNAVSFKIADGVKVPLALAATSVCSDKKVGCCAMDLMLVKVVYICYGHAAMANVKCYKPLAVCS